MYLVLIGWLYVALMMAAAEASAVNGTVLGAIVTFVLYGLLPVALVGYLLDAPRRHLAIAAREQQQQAESSLQPDAGGETTARAEPQNIASVRKEP